MSRICRFSLLYLFFAVLALAPAKAAYGFNGYIDPGSGLLMLQAIGSILVAVFFYFRSKIASLFRHHGSDPEKVPPAEASQINPEPRDK